MKRKIGLGILILALLLAVAAMGWIAFHFDHRDLARGNSYLQLKPLKKQLDKLEKEGKSNTAAHQILAETRWMLGSTRDSQKIAERIAALRAAIDDPANLDKPDEQSETDGSWGRWYTEWFFKLDASYDQIADLADREEVPKYPARFLDRINSPEKLTEHLNALLISNTDEGINHRRELNETIADLLRMVLRGWPANYQFHPQLKGAFLDFLMNKARNPETGYWGAWYRSGDRITRTDDLSITFHIVSYLKGDVPDWPKIIETTLAIKDKDYPLGWLSSGEYLNHNNMDVVQLFWLGWKQSTPQQQEAMRAEIRKMLNWCLKESLQADGSFRLTEHDDSRETAVSFGTSFLARIGYFDKKKRFWTDEDFPQAAQDAKRIAGYIHKHIDSGGEGGFYYKSALRDLGEKSH